MEEIVQELGMKNNVEGYTRWDNLDVKKLKRYVKEVSEEISRYRLSRQ